MLILSNTQIQELAIQKVNAEKSPELAIAIIQRAEKILQNRIDTSGTNEDNTSWSIQVKKELVDKKLAIARFGILGHVDDPTDDIAKLYETVKTRFEVKHNLGKGRIVVGDGRVFDIGNIANIDGPGYFGKKPLLKQEP